MKGLLVIPMMLVFVVAGCATSGDLEKVQAQERLINAKADQAVKDAQAAKASADVSKLQADAAKSQAEGAATRAENAVRKAEASERRADERERLSGEKLESAFRNSMRK